MHVVSSGKGKLSWVRCKSQKFFLPLICNEDHALNETHAFMHVLRMPGCIRFRQFRGGSCSEWAVSHTLLSIFLNGESAVSADGTNCATSMIRAASPQSSKMSNNVCHS